MKTKFNYLFLTLLSFLFCIDIIIGSEINNEQKGEQLVSAETQTLQIVSSPELYDLSTEWLSGFSSLHPDFKIALSSQTETNQFKDGNLYLLSGNDADLPVNNSSWKMVIGHELVVPVINTNNPYFDEIIQKGFTTDDFARLISGNSNWSDFIKSASKTPVQFIVTENGNVINKVEEFTKNGDETFQATKVNTATELISMVQRNVNAVGFCKLNDVLNAGKDGFAAQISILPIDKNRNGRIDSFENIYTYPATLTRAAWIGKYPRELCGEVYVMSTEKPTNQAALDFMAYLTVDGQDNIKKSGYSILSSAEKTANLLVLAKPVSSSQSGNKSPISTLGWILIFAAFGVVVLLVVFFGFKNRNKSMIDSDDIEITPALNENSILAPAGLHYDKTHTWAFMEQDGMVKIGIDDFLKHVVGSITQLKMKSPGEKVRKGEKILTVIRDGKQLNLYSPISGFIRKQNELLLKTPSTINNAAFTEGWVYQIEPANWAREVNFMFMIDKYRDWLKDEFTRLKDFVANSANSNQVVYQHIVLQDGGELKDDILADLGPEVWEDFQTQFIDTSK